MDIMNEKTAPQDNESASRLAIVGIIVQNPAAVEKLNAILHEFSAFIIGRMGIPRPEKHMSLISVALDAPVDEIDALAGKIGTLEGVSSTTVYPKG